MMDFSTMRKLCCEDSSLVSTVCILLLLLTNQPFQGSNMERDMSCDHEKSQVGDAMDEIDQVELQLIQLMNFTMGTEMQTLNLIIQQLVKIQQMCVLAVSYYIVHALHLLEMLSRYTHTPIRVLKRRRGMLMRQLVETEECRDIIGMSLFDDIPVPSLNPASFSSTFGDSDQSTATSGLRGRKRKADMADIVESQLDKVHIGINALVEAVKEVNNMSNRLVAVAEKQIQVAEKRLAIMQQSLPRHYTESDVWNALTELGVVESYKLQCYDFLCENEQKKREFFGLPPDLRLQVLFQMMSEAGIQ